MHWRHSVNSGHAIRAETTDWHSLPKSAEHCVYYREAVRLQGVRAQSRSRRHVSACKDRRRPTLRTVAKARSGQLQVGGGGFATFHGNLIADLLSVIQALEPSSLNGGDMDEYIFATVLRHNETISFGRVEPFNRPDGHGFSPSMTTGRLDGQWIS